MEELTELQEAYQAAHMGNDCPDDEFWHELAMKDREIEDLRAYVRGVRADIRKLCEDAGIN